MVLNRVKKITLRQFAITFFFFTVALIIIFTNLPVFGAAIGIQKDSKALIWAYSLVSVFLVSVVSLVGVTTLGLSGKHLDKLLLFLVSLSVGALLGDAMIHLLPDLFKQSGFALKESLYLLSGIMVFFIMEKIIHWQHCHLPPGKGHVHSLAKMNLIGDGLHNFIDGLIIGGTYLASIPLGIATTIAVIVHEIPQEISDFGVLLYGGFTIRRAVIFNFLTALTAILGTVVALLIDGKINGFIPFIIAFTAGGFIYIAVADLIPELHKETAPSRSLLQILGILIGIAVMVLFVFFE